MKNLRKYPSLLLVALFTVLISSSCNNEESAGSLSGEMIEVRVSTPQITESGESTEITKSGAEAPKAQTVVVPVSKSMKLEATLEPSPKAVTRGNTALNNGVKYRVIAFAQDNVTGRGYKSYGDFAVGTFGSVAGDLRLPSGVTYTFVCYSLNSSAALPVFDVNNLDITANPATDDLLYAKFNQFITEASQTLAFSVAHKFLQVTVIADATSLAQNITEISATLSPNYSATLNLSTGALRARTVTAAARIIPWGIITAGQTVTSESFTVFANASTEVNVSIPSVTIGGTAKTNLTATLVNTNLQPGYKYTLRLKFKEAPAVGITVAGQIWAPGNLIGKSDGNGGWTYTFAASQEYYSGKWYGGDYWGWRQLDPTNFTINKGNYSTSLDPCQQVAPAGTWRLPTRTNLVALMASGFLKGYKNGVRGNYFGTKTAPAAGTENNYLFLPLAGNRIGYSVPNKTYQAYYLSSSDFNAADNYFIPCLLDIDIYIPTGVIGYASFVGMGSSWDGASIRCVL